MSNIGNIRGYLGWSRERLSRATELSLSSILNIEHGKKFNSTTAEAIAIGLNIPLDKAFALCASTLSESELKTLAATIAGGRENAAIKRVHDTSTGSQTPPKDRSGSARPRTPRVTVHNK